MSEAALEEVSVLSSIYCGEGEFQLIQQSAADGSVVQIKSTVGEDEGVEVSLMFRLPPCYPSCLPDISVSSPALSRGQCHHIRQKLLDQAAALPQEPMVHQLVVWLQQNGDLTEEWRGGEEQVKESGEEEEEQWTAVLLLDHIRSRNRYVRLLECWSKQLQLTVRLLLGRPILVLLQGARPSIKEFCHLLKTVKVDVDASGRKCKERMMKILSETPSSSSKCRRGSQNDPPVFLVKEHKSVSELAAAFQEISMADTYQQILSSLTG